VTTTVAIGYEGDMVRLATKSDEAVTELLMTRDQAVWVTQELLAAVSALDRRGRESQPASPVAGEGSE
jgi:hypothetical protein